MLRPKVTPGQRDWIESHIGRTMKRHSRCPGTCIDWKLDVGGLGVFFILVDEYGDYWEKYLRFPSALCTKEVPRNRAS